MDGAGMINLAGTEDTEAAICELKEAEIEWRKVDQYGECRVSVVGDLSGWSLRRAWTHWVAEAFGHGGIRPESAALRSFDDKWGREARAYGFAGGEGLAVLRGPVRVFHIDTAGALAAWSGFIRRQPAFRKTAAYGSVGRGSAT